MPDYLDPDGFTEWEATVSPAYRRDRIWRTPAYRSGAWLSDLVKGDSKALWADREMRNNADQLSRAVDGISSNLAEGYGRTSGAERARYYEYAHASAREARDWYFKARDVLGNSTVDERHAVLERIIRILRAVIPRERGDRTRERRRRKPNAPPRSQSTDTGPGDSGSSP